MKNKQNIIYLSLIITLFFASCSPKEPVVDPTVPSTTIVTPGSSTTTSSSNTSNWIDTKNRTEVIQAYKKEFNSSLYKMNWIGDTSSCTPGSYSKDFSNALLSRLNYFRAVVGLQEKLITLDSLNETANWAAMLCVKNRQLNHFPPVTWRCFSDKAYYSCSHSNLAMGGVDHDFISLYMEDPGENNKAAGHRAWITQRRLKHIGLGCYSYSRNGYSVGANAFYVNNSFWASSKLSEVRSKIIAYPTEGYNIYNIVFPRWSFSYVDADVTKATVTVNGKPINDVTLGWNQIVWEMPSQTKPVKDQIYEVVINNVIINNEIKTISYQVIIIDPEK